MAQALELSPGERVLEVGAGSGYAAAVLSLLAGQVYAVECRPGLAESATRRLRELGYANVHIVATDGTEGLPEYAPFDGIMVSAAAPWVPLPLREQLGEGGRLVVPVGGRNAQLMLRLKRSDHQLHSERLGEVRFVPLIGAHAWHDSGDPLANEGE